MINAWSSLGALAATLLAGPVVPPIDAGPKSACPDDMRLVEGTHYETVAHTCVDVREGRKDTHCYKYDEDVSVMEGPTTDVRVCMDRYEAPNVRGARPKILASYVSAEKWCKKRKKRLCREEEWELACEGPDLKPYAYGWGVNVRMCNSNKQWKPVNFAEFDGVRSAAKKEAARLWQGTPSGHYRTCVSSYGIVDMMGNVEEWVTSRSRRKHPGSLMGGFWAKPWTGCRGTNDFHQPTFAFYETGFRCCQDLATGEPEDTSSTP